MTAQEMLDHYRATFPQKTPGLYHDTRVRVLSVARQKHSDMPAVIYTAVDSSVNGWCDADHFEKHFTPISS